MEEIDFISNTEEVVVTLLVMGVVFFFIEKISPAEPKTPFFKDDFKRELGLALFNGIIVKPVFTVLVSLLVVSLLEKYMPYQIFGAYLGKLPILAQMFMGAFIMDFGTYWRHRFTHAHMWPYHSVHHSVKEITWISALRLHPGEILVAMVFDVIILHVFGFSGPGIAFAMLFAMLYNYFLHANINVKYRKPFCYIFASPHYHRWHHANQKDAYDKNFCSMYSLLDVMFGTYHHPEELPKIYGLTKRQTEEYPSTSLWGQIAYPLRKNYQSLKEKFKKS